MARCFGRLAVLAENPGLVPSSTLCLSMHQAYTYIHKGKTLVHKVNIFKRPLWNVREQYNIHFSVALLKFLHSES